MQSEKELNLFEIFTLLNPNGWTNSDILDRLETMVPNAPWQYPGYKIEMMEVLRSFYFSQGGKARIIYNRLFFFTQGSHS